jgi:hypothetical protein
MHSTTIACQTSHLGFAIAPHFVSIPGGWCRFCLSNTFTQQCYSAGDPTLSARSCVCVSNHQAQYPCPSCVHPPLTLFVHAPTHTPTPHLHTRACPSSATYCPPRTPVRVLFVPVPPAHILTAMPFPSTFHVHVCTVPCFLACRYTYIACMIQKCL